jgi:hypothetical protein
MPVRSLVKKSSLPQTTRFLCFWSLSGSKNAAASYRHSTCRLSVLLPGEETTRMKKNIALSQACDGVVRYAQQAPPA